MSLRLAAVALTCMTRTLSVLLVAAVVGMLVASCGSSVAAFECSEKTKTCSVDGQPTCVPKDSPEYGCASPTTCLSCGALGQQHVTQASCDIIRGVCIVSACEVGYKHCTGMESGGCETSVNSDLMNCGACGKMCPAMVPNGSPACINGACVA